MRKLESKSEWHRIFLVHTDAVQKYFRLGSSTKINRLTVNIFSHFIPSEQTLNFCSFSIGEFFWDESFSE